MTETKLDEDIEHLFHNIIECDSDKNPAEWYMLFDCGHYSFDCTECRNWFLSEPTVWFCTEEECWTKPGQNPISYIRIEKL